MSAAGAGGCGPGPASGTGSGASNPRKFSEKIALHTQRQAEETAAFQEVMMDISSTRLHAQKVRLARNQGPYYGGSLPNVHQMSRTPPELQSSFSLEPSRSTRHHGLVERVQRDRRFVSPGRPYRSRPVDNSQYNSAYLSPPPDPSWRRNWSGHLPRDKTQLFRLPTTALNRTNSDSALHTSVMNPPPNDPFSPGGHSAPGGQPDRETRRMFPYPVPPIEENVLDEGKLLKAWDTNKLPLLTSRPKSCEVPGINIFQSHEQPSAPPHSVPPTLNTGGSLPDLSSLHFPSPLPTPLDQDEPGYPGGPGNPLAGGSSTGSLASTLTQLGLSSSGLSSPYHHHSGLLASLQGTLSNPSLQSSLSNPNIQSSLSSHSFPSSGSLHSSLSNPSLSSTLSAPSSLSSQSLHSSLSSSSLSGQPLPPSYSGQAPLSTSPRRRAQPPPLPLDNRRHTHTLSSITQGVPLDTSRLPHYHFSSQQQNLRSLGNAHNQNQCSFNTQRPAGQSEDPLAQNSQCSQNSQQNPQYQDRLEPPQQNSQYQGRPEPPQQNSQYQGRSEAPQQNTQYQGRSEAPQQSDQQRHSGLPQLHHISHSLASDLGLYNDSLFSSLLDDPYLTGRSNQQSSQYGPGLLQFSMEGSGEGLGYGSDPGEGLGCGPDKAQYHPMQDQQLLNNQNQNHSGDTHHCVPNIILTGDSPTGLSKEIASALSHVPGFEMDSFSLDNPLRMDPLALDLLEGDLMLADPSVEDSFRSDRLK